MGWLGAGVGAGIGMAVGGPIGAAIGAWIGSTLDNDEDKLVVICPHCNENVKIESEGRWTCPHCNTSFTYGDYEAAEENQVIFFVTLVSMLAKMAKADGVVCEKEIARISNFFDEMELDSEGKEAAITIFNNAKTNNTTIYEYAQQYSEIADNEMCEMIYTMLWDVANADGKIHPNENDILKNIVDSLGIPHTRYNEYQAPSQNDSQVDIAECYKILNCSESDTDRIIKQKYRKAVHEYHPDKIQSKGLPEGFIKFANEQVRKLNLAYETIQKHRKNT